MKNIYCVLTLIILLNLACSINVTALAHEKDFLIKNDFVKNNAPITDELLNFDLYKDMPFKLSVYTNKYANQPIKDELLEDSNFTTNTQSYIFSDNTVPDEYFIEKNIDLTKTRRIKPKNHYDFTKKFIPIQIRISKQLKSTREIFEGSTIPFIAQHDFEINGKKYLRGTKILGRVETISASDKMGIPESIKISNFYIPDGKEEIDLFGSISKNGANRAIWVYPLYQAGNICFYVAGFAFVPIHGGRAKLLTSEAFTVFYETQ